MLDELQAEVVLSRFGNGVSARETAERLKISARHVRRLTSAANRRLRSEGISLPSIPRGRPRKKATAASQIPQGDGVLDLDRLHAA